MGQNRRLLATFTENWGVKKILSDTANIWEFVFNNFMKNLIYSFIKINKSIIAGQKEVSCEYLNNFFAITNLLVIGVAFLITVSLFACIYNVCLFCLEYLLLIKKKLKKHTLKTCRSLKQIQNVHKSTLKCLSHL